MMCLTEGQTSDHIGAKILYPALLKGAKFLIGDKGYDSDEYRAALKDWRRVAMRYDRCAHTFFSAIMIAAIVIYWL